VDVAGYHHAIDPSALQHVAELHSKPATEAARGQVAVTDSDYDRVPEIVADPDYLGVKNHIGKDVVGYVKQMPNGHTLYVEEIRAGREQLALDSMRKFPGGRSAISVAEP
jgi:hypothetical protein